MKQPDYYPSLFDQTAERETEIQTAPPIQKTPKNKAETPAAESPSEIEIRLRKELCKKFEILNQAVRGNLSNVFDHFLEFTVNGWLVNGSGIPWWKYDEQETLAFRTFHDEWVLAMGEILRVKPWHDFLGYLYEQLVAGIRRKQGNGQFFTPETVCDFMAQIVNPVDGDKATDPCCGSGRLMLAAHAVHPGTIVHAQDLDRTCCMMAVCNFLIHGCRGTVTWGNSLDPTDIRETWAVNPLLGEAGTPLGSVPHIIHNPPTSGTGAQTQNTR